VTFAYSGDVNFAAIAGASAVRVVDTTAPSIGGVRATPDP
jgi:hypothetical protein